jgi:hypothetical protein
VLVPLLLGYAVILHAYTIKILIEWNLPKGRLGWMVVSYGTSLAITALRAVRAPRSPSRRFCLRLRREHRSPVAKALKKAGYGKATGRVVACYRALLQRYRPDLFPLLHHLAQLGLPPSSQLRWFPSASPPATTSLMATGPRRRDLREEIE